jgi:transcriptional regulator GlxA family with amidase domain
MSFGQYLNKQRIDRAIDLIRHSRHDLAQVAALCGYGEYSTFYRNFVRFAGIAPADLKRATDPGIGQRD